MIFLDDRVGSKELTRHFTPFGIDLQLTRLEFGDACFTGHGPTGECLIGVERKRITDLVQSMQSHRLSGHQLPGMLETYTYNYLIVEGIYRPGKTGSLELNRGTGWFPLRGILWRQVDHYLNTLELRAGVIIKRTGTEIETVNQIVSLYRYWNDKTWEQHRAHDQLYTNVPEPKRARFSYIEPTLVEKMAAQLPGIDRKARDVAKRFKSVKRMVEGTERDWREVKGIGDVLAKRIVKQLQEY